MQATQTVLLELRRSDRKSGVIVTATLVYWEVTDYSTSYSGSAYILDTANGCEYGDVDSQRLAFPRDVRRERAIRETLRIYDEMIGKTFGDAVPPARDDDEIPF